MEFNLQEWLNLFVRWFHVIAGISWIGNTYLFNWMERTLGKEIDLAAGANVAGQLWMVHGGGFYFVEKQKVPVKMPRTLHWFKWEAMLTWLSGITLLFIVYYWGGLMVESDSNVSEATAMMIGIGTLIAGWLVYDQMWQRIPIGKKEAFGVVISYLLLVTTAYVLSTVLSTRAAFMHVGALMGTIMVANVWIRILPGQRKMIAAVEKGEKPDMAQGLKAKRCSKHNTYMSVPLILLMISNHYPTATYGSSYGWLVLAGLILLGWGAAKLLRDGTDRVFGRS